MSWVLLFLAILHYWAGVHSQRTVTQPASKSVSTGQTLKLSCSKSSGSWDNRFWWIQQKSGGKPHYVQCSDGSSRGEGIPDRFTASGSGNTGFLTITNVQAEDEADYYCYCWYSTDSSYHSDPLSWGSETKTFPPV
uniref:Ig-like domain-containing protein n=1 Tax=Anolis carolinensis TaxID=28377 RepID=A0A803TMY9_ANOCA